MTASDFQKEILICLAENYRDRELKGTAGTGRRVQVKPERFMKSYGSNTADMRLKNALTAACDALEKEGFIYTKRLKYSDEVAVVYLCEDRLPLIEQQLAERYGYIVGRKQTERIRRLFDALSEKGTLLQCYEDRIRGAMENGAKLPSPEAAGDMIALLSFLEKDHTPVYLREASVLALGNSKKLEETYLHEICQVIREAEGGKITTGELMEAESGDMECLLRYGVIPAEQEILLKGNWVLTWEDCVLDVAKTGGAVAISGEGLERLRSIRLSPAAVMTVENKTSFLRMDTQQYALFYLGGYAGSLQISFLKKLAEQMPDISFFHFGDIDIGGFMIHRHLATRTGIDFAMYRMGIAELGDARFRNALRPLTEQDRLRAKNLAEDPVYHIVVSYMLQHNVKLEQEIVCYFEETREQE